MARKAIKSINWAALIERVPESEKNALAAFRAKSEQHLRRMAANPETAPKIDWSYYKRTVSTPGLVDKFQKQYEALAIPYPADKYTAKIEADEKEALKKMEEFVQEANKAIEESHKTIKEIESLLPVADMTMEDFKDLYPHLAWDRDNPTVWPHTPDVQPDAVGPFEPGKDH